MYSTVTPSEEWQGSEVDFFALTIAQGVLKSACGFVPRHDRAARNRAVPFRARSDVRHEAVPFRALLREIVKFFHNFMYFYCLF